MTEDAAAEGEPAPERVQVGLPHGEAAPLLGSIIHNVGCKASPSGYSPSRSGVRERSGALLQDAGDATT